MEVTLWQMLDARERRAERQKQLLAEWKTTLVCFTMNIPGPVKQNPLISRAFREGCRLLEARLPGILHRETREEVTGCEGMYAVAGEASAVKAICAAIEDDIPLGRLFDMDVLDTNGRKLDREQVGGGSRNCIVCGAPGRACASRRTHSVETLQAAARNIMAAHFAKADRETIAALAVESLLEEVNITPKPGLVDRQNSGSHRDMDLGTFTASANALRSYFRECAALGQETAASTPEETFPLLRQAGLRAEKAMYRATGGVNTHKGAIFTMGILCGCMGRLWTPESPAGELPRLLAEAARMGEETVRLDFPNSTGATAGERLYRSRGIRGIRGEVAAGLPAVMTWGLPVLRACLAEGYSRNDAGAITLIHLAAHVEDTNLFHRGGQEGADWAREAAKELLPRPSIAQIEALDQVYTARNLSPGGCADLLAVTCFLDKVYGKYC